MAHSTTAPPKSPSAGHGAGESILIFPRAHSIISALHTRAGVSEWQTMRTQNPLVATPCGFKSHRRHHMNEPHFSNCFIEKRGSSYVESLVTRGFLLFVAPDLFFKISQMQKQYFYVGLKFRQCFPIKQACEHLQMPVMSYHSAFGEAALHYRTEYAPLRFCRNVVQRYSPSGRLPLS